VPKRWAGFVALLLLLLLGVPAAPGWTEALAQLPGDDRFVIVQYDTGVSAQALMADGASPSLADMGYRRVPVPPGKTTGEYLAELRSTPGVVSAEQDARVYAAAAPNDPYYASNQAAYLTRIGVPAAWDFATGTGTIVVAVLDTGTDLGHEDFAGRLWENTRDAASDGIDHDGNGCANDRYGCRFVDITPANSAFCGYTSSANTGAVLDDHGKPGAVDHSHGTLVAGIIGAAGDNGKGIAGVAWNVKIMTVKVLDCGSGVGGRPSGAMFNVAQGIDYARRMGANVISLSLASKAGDQSSDLAIMRSAIQAAQDQGIIIVAAAGNHTGNDPVGVGYPAAYTQFTNLVAVGASDTNAGTWAPYSNYGPAVDFAAPGDHIASTVRTDMASDGPYRQASDGTSFSTPLVAGMFALMLSRNPLASPADLIQIARDTATPVPAAPHGQNWAGAGIINVGAAVARVPMTITGSALHDWKDLPAGTEVRAVIDGNECGSVASFAFGVLNRFVLRVRSAAEQPGCGAPGKTVQLFVGPRAATPTFSWGARNEPLGFANKDVSSVSAPPGAIVVQTLNSGWSNIAHLEASGSPGPALSYLPGGWTTVYRWTAGADNGLGSPGAYDRFTKDAPDYANGLSTVEQFDALWSHTSAASVASLNPNPTGNRVVGLKPGWNNVVYTGTTKSVEDALAEVAGKYTQVMQYDNASQTWLSYLPGQRRYLNDFGGLFKFKLYWVYMTAPGSVTMQ
jgi:hypothetical protein